MAAASSPAPIRSPRGKRRRPGGLRLAMTHDASLAGTAPLAAFLTDHPRGGLPAEIRAHAVRCILNGVGTALGGARDRAVDALLATLGEFSARQTATILGRSECADPPTAAFLNAVAINVFDFDDTHYDTILHPTAPVLPVLFALAEERTVAGADLVEAFALGAEVACRIAVAVSPTHYRRGWHITSTCGVFGAAAAAGRLLGLDTQRMIWALGNASAMASGLVETLGTMAKSVGVGGSARNGLLAALMAERGVEGPPLPLEGRLGFVPAFSDSPSPEALTAGLGTRWELLNNTFKPYPCGVVLNPVIDACLALAGRADFDVGAIGRVETSGNALLKARTDRPDAATGREAQVSAQHAVAVCLLRGSAGIADFDDEAVRDPRVLALRAKIASPLVDDTLPIGAARLVVHLQDGSRLEQHVAAASGSLKKPMTDAALEAKFRALTRYGSPEVDAEPLLRDLWRIDEAADVAPILAAARPRA